LFITIGLKQRDGWRICLDAPAFLAEAMNGAAIRKKGNSLTLNNSTKGFKFSSENDCNLKKKNNILPLYILDNLCANC
jgi:hypothetical protein